MTTLFILAGALFLTGLIVKSPWFKGWIGEFQVNMAARFFLDKRIYRLVRNVTLPTADGTTQIDHVIVSPYGVFAVETKNLRGWIFGGECEEYWTQKIFKYTNRFQNPLRQNYKHTRTLAELLGLPPEKIKSVIVFVGDSEFKTPMPDNVTYAGGYIRYIKGCQQEVLSDAELEGVLMALAEKRLAPGLRTHFAHAQHVRQIVDAKQQRPDPGTSAMLPDRPASPPPGSATSQGPRNGVAVTYSPTCPRCRAPMVLRTSKQGPNAGKSFWGCSQFPRCRAIIEPSTTP